MSESMVRYTLAERQGLPEIRQCLPRNQPLRTMAPVVTRRRVMDSFDWRLYRKGGVIEEVRQGRRVSTGWRELASDRLQRPLLKGRAPRFARRFPAGPLQEFLRSVLDMRALVPLLDIESHSREIRVLDANEKTVARLYLEQHTVASPGGEGRALPASLRLQPVRGYGKHFHRIRKRLERDLGLQATDEPLVTAALAGIGRRPMDYIPKPDIPLAGDMPAPAAVVAILRKLFDTMEANEHGLIHDIDSEFLHDFRVAVRRTRCALKQLGRVLPAHDVERFLADFAWLGSVTGGARDLDVYMLHLDDYEAALPGYLQGALEPLRGLIAGRLKQEKRQLVGQLRSARYRDIKRDYRAFLDATFADDMTIAELANRRIEKVFGRVLREGRAIHDSSPPEELHELRKTCKKLRYLLEFFRHLHAGSEIARLIRALKKLQDNLGSLQDLAVQIEALHSFRSELAASGELPARSHEAMEVLVQQLQHRHDAARMAFAARFRKFASARNRHRFGQLLGQEGA